MSRGQHHRLLDEDTRENLKSHPLDSPSIFIRAVNSLFYLWIFRFVKIGKKIQFNDLPNLPFDRTANESYKKWQNVYHKRKQQNKSTSTVSMIYHIEKLLIIRIIILELIGYSLFIICYGIFKNYLWPSLYSSNITNISKYTLIIFFLVTIKSITITYTVHETQRIQQRVQSSLYKCLYNKTLSLDINQSDKQQVVNIVGSDVQTINDGFWFLCGYTVPVIIMMTLSMVALYAVVGISSIFGILFLLFIGIPFQLFGGYKLSYYSNERMSSSDKRVQLITELIRGIRVLKLSAIELPLMDKVCEYRNNELKYISKKNFYLSLIILSNFLIPAIMLLLTLTIYSFIFNHKINSNITLFILMLFQIIQIAVRVIPIVIGTVVSFLVSCDRIDMFLKRQSVNIGNVGAVEYDKHNGEDIAIEIDIGSFVWMAVQDKEKDEKNDKIGFSLKNISLKIKRGKLIAILGSVGCGKTSLIQSILKEMKCIKGHINVDLEEIIYCSQIPYIRNVTLRENIILELPFDEIKYKQCIIASALKSDLRQLPNYDLTLIGDEGVTLSGGQKMRVAFARTLYRKIMNKDKKQIYLFDDALSCVDIYVGKSMFFDGIYKYIMNRGRDNYNNNNDTTTCLMVMNSHLHLIKYFDEIIIMDNGEIKVHSTIKDLYFDEKNNNLLQQFQHLLPNYDSIVAEETDQEDEERKDEEKEADNDDDDDDDFEEFLNINEFNETFVCKDDFIPNWMSLLEFGRSSLTKFDYRAYWNDDTETIKNSEIKSKSKGKILILILPLIICILFQCGAPICDLWILYWNQQIVSSGSTQSTLWYLSIWFILISIIGFATIFSMYLLGRITLKAADHVHSKSLYNILRANVLFFDITPRGDILDRFSKETQKMDINFTENSYQFMLWISSLIGYSILIMVFIPYSILPFLIIFVPFILYINYRHEICRFSCLSLYNQHHSPILSLFSETVTSLDSIRSYKLEEYFMNDLNLKIDDFQKCNLIYGEAFLWLLLYQEMLLNLLQMIVIMIAGFQINSISSTNNYDNNNKQFIILSCWYFFGVQQQISWASLDYCNAKRWFSSIMRLMFYHKIFEENKNLGKEIVHEAKQINHDYRIPNNSKQDIWPKHGNININQLQLKYRKKFKIVLNINNKIKINNGDHIGICGRTGSGKSSILVSIFRLFEPVINDTIIDNMKINKLGLNDLRSNLSIISQNPILFNGNLRFNLDPFHKYSDNEIWTALKNVQLFHLINNRNGKLMCNVEANGSNFSVGQKQLICFARSILSKSKIIFMDEATSSIDKYTDNIIQKLIRSETFKDCTVITIAHRLQTIIDYDYILLLKNGKIAQYDKPQNLLSNKNNDFYKLVKNDKLYYSVK